MARGKPHASRSATSAPALPPPWAAVNRQAAGLDSGAASHDVAVPPRDDASPVRCCGACPADLEALADGLAAWGMTTVARESTGVSGLPLVA
jgi:transposase